MQILIKADLHIHTKASISDANFEFSFEVLKDYVNQMQINCIAITNHNLFDKEQYLSIKDELDIEVFPGIEINIESGHMLLITNGDNLSEFCTKCDMVEELITTKKDFVTVEQFKSIFTDLNNYILIPHYDKRPKLNANTLNDLSEFITAGEVTSIKKFIYCMKSTESLVPVIFSDTRMSADLKKYPVSQTYFNIEEVGFSAIKYCLNDKQKVSLSSKKDFFHIFENGQLLSTGLNVVIGERSSGKTYTLKRINEAVKNVKYIHQFELLEKDDDDGIKNFKRLLSTNQDTVTEEYLKELKTVIDDVKDIDLANDELMVESYVDSLMKNALETEKADSYSNTSFYNETKYNIDKLENLEELIRSVQTIIDNTEYRTIVDKFINTEDLRSLITELISTYRYKYESNLKKMWVNDLLESIQRELQSRSAATRVEDIDFEKILSNKLKIIRFTNLVNAMKSEKQIMKKEIQGFTVVAIAKPYSTTQELFNRCGRRLSFANAFSKYSTPYEFLQELKNITGLPETEYYRFFLKVEYKILNKHGYEVSGGERSEFNLLQEINNALQYDMLLIDEPESSFDNLFLKNNVNQLLKDISKHIPVLLVTHNSTVGASIMPDYIIYTRKVVNGDGVEYKVYSGHPSDRVLRTVEGEEINNYEILINCLEAGEITYSERGRTYETLKN